MHQMVVFCKLWDCQARSLFYKESDLYLKVRITLLNWTITEMDGFLYRDISWVMKSCSLLMVIHSSCHCKSIHFSSQEMLTWSCSKIISRCPPSAGLLLSCGCFTYLNVPCTHRCSNPKMSSTGHQLTGEFYLLNPNTREAKRYWTFEMSCLLSTCCCCPSWGLNGTNQLAKGAF